MADCIVCEEEILREAAVRRCDCGQAHDACAGCARQWDLWVWGWGGMPKDVDGFLAACPDAVRVACALMEGGA